MAHIDDQGDLRFGRLEVSAPMAFSSCDTRREGAISSPRESRHAQRNDRVVAPASISSISPTRMPLRSASSD